MKTVYIILQRDPYSPAGAVPVFASFDIELVEQQYANIQRQQPSLDVYIYEVEFSGE